MLRAEAGGPTERFAVAAGFLSVLWSLAADQPVLVAVDDVQRLDAASAELLVFAARRAEGHWDFPVSAFRPVRYGRQDRAGEQVRLVAGRQGRSWAR